MAKPVVLANGRSWKTQLEAKAHFKKILGRHANGQQITDPEDHGDLMALLTKYDKASTSATQTKAGCGVRSFFKDKDLDHPGSTSCFFVERIDGTKVDFSFHRAVETASKQSNS